MTKPTLKKYSLNNISFSVGSMECVNHYFEKLNLNLILKGLKKKGHNLTSLTKLLVNHKLGDNLSISKCHEFGNQIEILDKLNLNPFHEKALYRTLESLGESFGHIIGLVNNKLSNLNDYSVERVNLDWSSVILYGTKSNLGAHGYSRDHRPDKEQITFGVANVGSKGDCPLALTVQKGNVPDITHFEDTFRQSSKHMEKETLYVFDKGANSKENLDMIRKKGMHFLTAKKINKSDKDQISIFKEKLEIFLSDKSSKKDKKQTGITTIDSKKGIYGLKYKPKNSPYYNYLYYSKELEKKKLATKEKAVLRKFKEAQEIQECLDKKKFLPKKYQINNDLISVKLEYETKLKELTENDAKKLVRNQVFSGNEGYFILISSKSLDLKDALKYYRSKDSIEKFIEVLKNTVNVKPLRVWSDNAIKGSLLIGYLAYLILALLKIDNPKLSKISPKFIKQSLKNLTVTIEKLKNKKKREIFSNFDWICREIFDENLKIPG